MDNSDWRVWALRAGNVIAVVLGGLIGYQLWGNWGILWGVLAIAILLVIVFVFLFAKDDKPWGN